MEQKISIKESVVRRKSSRSYDLDGLTAEELSQVAEHAKNIPLFCRVSRQKQRSSVLMV